MAIEQQIGNKTVIIKGKQGQNPVVNQNDCVSEYNPFLLILAFDTWVALGNKLGYIALHNPDE